MKYVVDTCGWVEWVTNGKLAHLFEPYLTHEKDLFVPTLVQYELYKWVCREENVAKALEVVGMTEAGTVISLDSNLALCSADFSKQYGLAMADAIIYATSRRNEAVLVTSDSHFKELPHVKFFKKANC